MAAQNRCAMNVKRVLTDSDFVVEFKKASENPQNLIVLDFFATWCSDCTELDSEIDELSRSFPSVCFIKVDVDTCSVSSIK